MSKGRGLDDVGFKEYSSTVRDKPREKIFTRRTMKSDTDARKSFDPKTIGTRESRDSEAYPNSTPLMLAFDVTGSMGGIPEYFIKEGLGILVKEVFDRKPITDPQIMCLAVGDSYYDRAPLQATQFEVDIKIVEQLQDLFLEGGGGPNAGESYHLPWYFAATKTSTDAFEKRGKKGILFTIGDEPPLAVLPKSHIKQIFGDDVQDDMTSEQLLEMVRRQYEVFHIIVEQGRGMSYDKDRVINAWNNLLGKQHVLRLSDYTKLSEVVTSVLQVVAGEDPAAVSKSWSGDTSLVVATALKDTVPAVGKRGGGGAIKGPVPLRAPEAA